MGYSLKTAREVEKPVRSLLNLRERNNFISFLYMKLFIRYRWIGEFKNKTIRSTLNFPFFSSSRVHPFDLFFIWMALAFFLFLFIWWRRIKKICTQLYLYIAAGELRNGDESLMIHKQLKLRQNVTLFRWLPLRSGTRAVMVSRIDVASTNHNWPTVFTRKCKQKRETLFIYMKRPSPDAECLWGNSILFRVPK